VFDRLIARTPIDPHASSSSGLSWALQKLVHVALFLSMGAVAARAEAQNRWLLPVGATAVVAEALQAFTFSRSAEWRDAILNLVCVIAGYSLARHKFRNVR
jgi:hypothetical protein